jgi:hypothetical protein
LEGSGKKRRRKDKLKEETKEFERPE